MYQSYWWVQIILAVQLRFYIAVSACGSRYEFTACFLWDESDTIVSFPYNQLWIIHQMLWCKPLVYFPWAKTRRTISLPPADLNHIICSLKDYVLTCLVWREIRFIYYLSTSAISLHLSIIVFNLKTPEQEKHISKGCDFIKSITAEHVLWKQLWLHLSYPWYQKTCHLSTAFF